MVNYKDYKETLKEKFEKIKVRELVEYCNKYIGEGFEIGKVYDYHGLGSICYAIQKNVTKGMLELFNKYGIDADYGNDIIKIDNNWYIYMYIQYDIISICENIIQYNFGHKQRKNASVNNSKFTLTSFPVCIINNEIVKNMVDIIHDFNSMNIAEMSLDELITYLLEGKRQRIMANLQKEVLSLKREIDDKKKVINHLEDIII